MGKMEGSHRVTWKHYSRCFPKAGDSSTTTPPAGENWVCTQSSEAKKENHNKHITEKLEVLAKVYTHQGDKWRALGYSKAINALQNYHKTVSSFEVWEMTLSLNPGLWLISEREGHVWRRGCSNHLTRWKISQASLVKSCGASIRVPRGQWEPEEVSGSLSSPRTWAPETGYYCDALQRVCMCLDVLHGFGTFQPVHAGLG
ncbi:DNA polymerase lambda-like [Acipenser oxyrinchus oxyrinchus]|uniref:DNA polymerase lambda-like n=1 Tax=Acipenser oxyrinchus oxyrinchus TaxID=40147 RepID=A0AAD8D693_ACIOX|nr:DNA polymerase lambda-like [Acipenser oxyrinchus oxyrinchus]